MSSNDTYKHARPIGDVGSDRGIVSRMPQKRKKIQLGKEAFETLLGLLNEADERHDSPLGLFVANSTKRDIRAKVEELFAP